MQVRRKTPILEARQFTEESAVGLIKDGWLSDVGVINGEAWGRVTRSVTRSREVLLDGWIVLEQMRNEVVADGQPKSTVAYFRPLSAEQFVQDFELSDGKPADTLTLSGVNRATAGVGGVPLTSNTPPAAPPEAAVPTMDLLENGEAKPKAK